MESGRGLIVIAEDDPTIAEIQRLYLSRAGYGVHVCRDGRDAREDIRRLGPVAVVLDVGLPGMDGIEICRGMRVDGDWTPVLFVTARDEEVDRILGLEIGADDYITKPFSPRELVARLGAILRRHTQRPGADVLAVAGVRLDRARRTVTVADEPVALTATEFDLLSHLMDNAERVLSREQLMSAVWGQVDYGSGRTVDVHIAQLRAKLGPGSPLRTVRGIGYVASAVDR